jgi:hypothetical protein
MTSYVADQKCATSEMNYNAVENHCKKNIICWLENSEILKQYTKRLRHLTNH